MTLVITPHIEYVRTLLTGAVMTLELAKRFK